MSNIFSNIKASKENYNEEYKENNVTLPARS